MLGVRGDEVSIMKVVYSRGMVIVSPLGYFSSVGSYSKLSCPSLPLYLRARYIQEYLNKKSRSKEKTINPHQGKARH